MASALRTDSSKDGPVLWDLAVETIEISSLHPRGMIVLSRRGTGLKRGDSRIGFEIEQLNKSWCDWVTPQVVLNVTILNSSR